MHDAFANMFCVYTNLPSAVFLFMVAMVLLCAVIGTGCCLRSCYWQCCRGACVTEGVVEGVTEENVLAVADDGNSTV